MQQSRLNQRWTGYAISVLSTAALTAILKLLDPHANPTTVALVLLLNVLFIATRWGSFPGFFASVIAMLCFNFFFLPPFGTLTIAAVDNWIALAAFLITAITAGQLSARAKKRAEEAETGRVEIERLYAELRDAFERASHAEALKQSEKLKSALLDAVTHDLRTPLASIKASVTTLIDDAKGDQSMTLDSDSRLDMLEVIDQESDRLNQFIGDLIELARIEAGELQLRPRLGALEEIVATALVRAEPLTAKYIVAVEIEEALPNVRVDDRAVSEVIYALVDNAAKYSPPNSTIRISAKRADDSMIQLAIEDSGKGVPVALRERVFDKFFRAMRDGDVSTHIPSGTGMGLAIAKGIVEAHNGRIWIETGADEKGTRVCFTLPTGSGGPMELDAKSRAESVQSN